jgi:hypothetical protein
MNDNELQQAMITISSSEFTNWGLKIRDEKNLIYNIPQFKKGTNEETAAYKYITNLPKNGVGLTKGVKFVVVPNNQGGQSRYIRIMEDANAQTAPQAPQSTQSNQKTGYTQKNETDWEKISFGKCKYGFLIELLKMGVALQDAETVAETWAEASMRKLQQPKTYTPNNQPDFPDEDSIQIENIPF